MADSHWIEIFRSLPPPTRVAVLGALAVPASMLFPWYGIPSAGGLATSGFASFGLGQLALLLTVAATLYLVLRCARGYVPPRPLSEAGLIVAGGSWSILLIGYLMIDRPNTIAGFHQIGLRYGIFLSLGGAIAMIVGGMRLRALGQDPSPSRR